jgi:hypothetical protein
MADIGIDLGTLESLLQVFIYRLVGDFTEECQVGYSNLLLLGGLVSGLLRLAA